MPVSVQILSKHSPQIWNQKLPNEGVVLVFDHVPEGYRKAYEWIVTKQHMKSPVYRLLVPCTIDGTAEDLCDYEALAENKDMIGPKPMFTGCIDLWPEDTVFGVQRIELDIDDIPKDPDSVDWPNDCLRRSGGGEANKRQRTDEESVVLLSRLYMCGFCSERSLLFPNPFTGVTDIQQFILDTVGDLTVNDVTIKDAELRTGKPMQRSAVSRKIHRGAYTVNALVQFAAAHFRVSPTLVMDQFERLTFGNEPWIVSKPTRSAIVVLNPRMPHIDPTLPMWLLNGPYPVSASVLKSKFKQMLVHGKDYVEWDDTKPSCAPKYEFTYVGSEKIWKSKAAAGAADATKPPYGVTMSEFTKQNSGFASAYGSVKTYGGGGVIKALDSAPVNLQLTFAVGNRALIKFHSLGTYAKDWFKRNLNRIALQTDMEDYYDKRTKAENKFLSQLYWQPLFMDPRTGHQIKMYADESLEAAKQRIETTYGKQYAAYLMSLPVYKISRKALGYADPLPEEAKSARTIWLESLERLITGTQYAGDSEEEEE